MFRGALLISLISIIIAIIFNQYFRDELPQHFGGHVDAGFEAVEHAFRYNFERGFEVDGSAFAVYHRGKLVVDLWGGYADKLAARKWKENTITTAFSSTKGASAICIAMLVDRGYLSYNDLVIKHWPEFGAHGKANVTVKMLVSHQAGLAAIDKQITPEIIRDWRLMSKIFEDQKPNFPPGTDILYHALTFGWLCDQLIRRVDPQKRSLSQFFREEIAQPFGIDFFIGLPRDQLHRVTRMTKAGIWDLVIRLQDRTFAKTAIAFVKSLYWDKPSALFQRALTNPDFLMLHSKYFPFNDPDIHELEIPGANGVGTARALARLYSLLGDSKKPLVNASLIEKISLGEEYLAFGFDHTISPGGNPQIGHPGYGGQSGKLDAKEHLSFSYLRNNMAFDMMEHSVSLRNLQTALYESIEKLKKNEESP